MRALAIVLVILGGAGTVAVVTGWMSGGDGTLAFPAALFVGVAVLLNRGRKAPR